MTTTPNPSSPGLHGQTLLITGANRGIGLTLLEQALDRGAEVPDVSINPEAATDLNRLMQVNVIGRIATDMGAATGLTDVAEPPAVVEGEVSE